MRERGLLGKIQRSQIQRMNAPCIPEESDGQVMQQDSVMPFGQVVSPTPTDIFQEWKLAKQMSSHCCGRQSLNNV
jgi:hypothetical protein